MPERRASLMEPRMEHLLDQVGSKFTLVTLAAKRAREINDYYNQLGEGLGRIVPPQVTSVSRKPLSIALEEIDAGKILFERIVEPDEPGAEEPDHERKAQAEDVVHPRLSAGGGQGQHAVHIGAERDEQVEPEIKLAAQSPPVVQPEGEHACDRGEGADADEVLEHVPGLRQPQADGRSRGPAGAAAARG